MNTANLQLEGLYLAIAAVNEVLVEKGVLTREEIRMALERAKQAALGDYRSEEDLSPANRDAMAFPARLLLLANDAGPDAAIPSFSELAKMVAGTKRPHNDLR